MEKSASVVQQLHLLGQQPAVLGERQPELQGHESLHVVGHLKNLSIHRVATSSVTSIPTNLVHQSVRRRQAFVSDG